MSTVELKDRVIKNIKLVEDTSLLEEILWLLDTNKAESDVLKIPLEHIEGVEKGLRDVAEGRVLTSEQVNERFKKWL